jgi:hypothetical protein
MLIEPFEARERLIKIGDYTVEDAPTEEALQLVLEGLEAYLLDWLGFYPGVLQYEEVLPLNPNSLVMVTNFPVISIDRVALYWDYQPHLQTLPVQVSEVPVLWRQGRTFAVSACQCRWVKVWYTAGISPVPKEVQLTLFQLLRKALEEGGTSGDLSFLYEPTRDVTNISIPGMSKSWALGGANAANNNGGGSTGTIGDRMLRMLQSLRRNYIT